MQKPIHMPKYGLQQDEGTVVEWHKKEGDHVEKGEVILSLETDKALFDYEAPDTGYLRQIVAQEGDVVPVLSVIAVLTDEPDEPVDLNALSEEPAAKVSEETAIQPDSQPKTEPAPAPEFYIKSSPAARRRARELGIDLQTVTGTGPRGRITRTDIENAAAHGAIKKAPLTRMRRAIGAAMAHSKSTAPHFYVAIEIDMTDAETWRKQQTAKLSATDLFVKAAAKALIQFPALNASLDGNDIITHSAAHIGLAVGTDEGLVVPVIPNAHQKSLTQLATDRVQIVQDAREGRMRGDTAATFTITNLGMYGVSSFTAIINPPEAGILAISAILPQVRPIGEPLAIAVRRIVELTLSADHRLVDGLIAAQFLQSVKQDLENTDTLKGWV